MRGAIAIPHPEVLDREAIEPRRTHDDCPPHEGRGFALIDDTDTARAIANDLALLPGDGVIDVAVFRPSLGNWYVRYSSTGGAAGFQWGNGADIPVPGDYHGDSKTDIAIFRPGPGDWWILRSSDSQVQFVHWGQSGDRPVQADYDDDGKTDIAVFRLGPADWYILKSSDGQMLAVHWGQSGDRPVPGDYDGDGRADIAIQRPDSTEAFWILPTSTGSHYVVSGFGQFPVPLGYLSTRSWY